MIQQVQDIVKQDDYYRQIEELPVIDPLVAFNDVQLFPQLFDMKEVICRVTQKTKYVLHSTVTITNYIWLCSTSV